MRAVRRLGAVTGERAEAVWAGMVREPGEQVEVPLVPAGAQAVTAESREWAPAEREAMVEQPAPGPVVRRGAMADTEQAAAPEV